MLTDPSSKGMRDNHIETMRAYHLLLTDWQALVCSLLSQSGVLVNGASPVVPAECKVVLK